MDDARPRSVTAVTRRFKPEFYPRVDDEAQAIIQTSRNWPFDRKDMEVYGRSGQVLTVAQDGVRVRLEGQPEEPRRAAPLPAPHDDFLRSFAAVARREIAPSGPSSLPNNLVVIEILDAARRSAAEGKTVRLD